MLTYGQCYVLKEKGSPWGELAPKVTERGYIKALSVTLTRATSPIGGGFFCICLIILFFRREAIA